MAGQQVERWAVGQPAAAVAAVLRPPLRIFCRRRSRIDCHCSGSNRFRLGNSNGTGCRTGWCLGRHDLLTCIWGSLYSCRRACALCCSGDWSAPRPMPGHSCCRRRSRISGCRTGSSHRWPGTSDGRCCKPGPDLARSYRMRSTDQMLDSCNSCCVLCCILAS